MTERAQDRDSRGTPLLRGWPRRAATQCPDANVLAAMASGNISRRHRARLGDHLACCDECRVLVGELLTWTPPSTASKRWQILASVIGAAAAAVVLLTIGAWFDRVPHVTVAKGSTRERLVAAARALESADPTLYQGLGAAILVELANLGPLRGNAPAALLPRSATLDDHPQFSWQPARNGQYEIVIEDQELRPVARFMAATSPTPYPEDAAPLLPGARYSWRITDLAAQPSIDSNAVEFTISSAADRQRLERAFAGIEARIEAPLCDLATAHFALSRGLYAIALTAARRCRRLMPDDPASRNALDRVLSELGVTEP